MTKVNPLLVCPSPRDIDVVYQELKKTGYDRLYAKYFPEKTAYIFGVRIPADTTTTLTVRIRDDLSSGLNSFNCVANGFLRLDEKNIQEE